MVKLLLCLCVVLMSSGVLYDVYASANGDSGQVLLRRLREAVESDPRNDTSIGTKTVWSDVVAKELVARIIPSPHNKDLDGTSNGENKSRILSELTSCISGVLTWYKNNVYDVFFNRDLSQSPENSETEAIGNPKEDVEIIEPKYHGRICEEDGCKHAKPAECPEGETRNSEGVCVNNRMILRIPSRCPIGYLMDRSGYCRQLW